MPLPTPDLVSESFGAMGNAVADGVCNQLGRPELDRLTLLIRESVQNSWDARTDSTIRFSLESQSLGEAQRDAFRRFFEQQPPSVAYETSSSVTEKIASVSSWLSSAGPRILVISDRGTTGLDGPTRADEVAGSDGERNFVDFLRNIGQPPGRPHTGGTFGYGKAALYLASETRTILVYTRCLHRGRLQSRLTAAALTHHYAFRKSRFTGRHWWGRLTSDGIAEPFLDRQADELAEVLGLPPFTGDERGTSIAITAPAFDDGELRDIGLICLRNLWPKLKAVAGGRPPVTLLVKVAGLPVAIPDPASLAPYDAYWRAYSALTEEGSAEIKYSSDVIGRLALARAVLPRASDKGATAAEHELRPQHVALLRTPELVVKYLDAGRGLGNEHVGFVGVFKTAAEFDDVFARAEPPTHDDWQPSSVSDKRSRGIVNTALKRVRERCRDFASLHSPRVQGAEGSSLAQLAREFAILAPGVSQGATREHDRSRGDANEGSRPVRSARPQVRLITPPGGGLQAIDKRVHALFFVEVVHASGTEATIVTAHPYPVVSGGAREQEPPAGKTGARVAWWESPRGVRIDGVTIRVGPRQQGQWKLFVPLEDNVAVGVELESKAEGTA